MLRKTSARRGLGVEKHVFCGLHKKGINVGNCGVWEAHHNKGIRNGQERPGTREKEIEFERDTRLPKTRAPALRFGSINSISAGCEGGHGGGLRFGADDRAGAAVILGLLLEPFAD